MVVVVVALSVLKTDAKLNGGAVVPELGGSSGPRSVPIPPSDVPFSRKS